MSVLPPYRIRFYREADAAPEAVRDNVASFLETHMPEGSVVTSPTMFHQGCSWTLALGAIGSWPWPPTGSFKRATPRPL